MVVQKFFINTQSDAEKCKESRRLKEAISISGIDFETGKITLYNGTIIAITDSRGHPQGRWRVVIDD